MVVKMNYVVAMCRRGVLNSKSKSLFAICPAHLIRLGIKKHEKAGSYDVIRLIWFTELKVTINESVDLKGAMCYK